MLFFMMPIVNCLWSLIKVMCGEVKVVLHSFLQFGIDLPFQFAHWSPVATTTTVVVSITIAPRVRRLLLLLLGELLRLELVVEVFFLLLLGGLRRLLLVLLLLERLRLH